VQPVLYWTQPVLDEHALQEHDEHLPQQTSSAAAAADPEICGTSGTGSLTTSMWYEHDPAPEHPEAQLASTSAGASDPHGSCHSTSVQAVPGGDGIGSMQYPSAWLGPMWSCQWGQFGSIPYATFWAEAHHNTECDIDPMTAQLLWDCDAATADQGTSHTSHTAQPSSHDSSATRHHHQL